MSDNLIKTNGESERERERERKRERERERERESVCVCVCVCVCQRNPCNQPVLMMMMMMMMHPLCVCVCACHFKRLPDWSSIYRDRKKQCIKRHFFFKILSLPFNPLIPVSLPLKNIGYGDDYLHSIYKYCIPSVNWLDKKLLQVTCYKGSLGK